MTIDERVARLREYRQTVEAWRTSRDSAARKDLRRFMHENMRAVERDVLEAGCLKRMTISPPRAVGGLVMHGVDPFEAMFDPPYLSDLTPIVIDMLDQAIGVMSNPEFAKDQERAGSQSSQSDEEMLAGYVFVAMPIDPDDPALEDVLDSIREACGRCGLQAERIDEAESNERVTDRILESIRRAQFVVVDLTHARPNVFYEAGYAHGRGKLPIYVAREGTKLEFDLKDYPVIFFRNMKDLKDSLERRLRALSPGDI
jgi:hypothetical protein